MKKFLFYAVCALMMGFATSCGDDSDEPGIPGSNENVDDPVGTITLSMRSEDYGKTYLKNVYIDESDNFRQYSYDDYGIASIGPVKGLGNVAYIPTTGWAHTVAVVPGHGYMIYEYGNYTRLYVEDYIISTTGGVIGAVVKYQEPFYGVDEEIKLSETSLTFDGDGGEQRLAFDNDNIFVFKATSSESWCHVYLASTHDNFFPHNAISIVVDPATVIKDENDVATVTLETAFGKTKEITVTRINSNATPQINIDNSPIKIGVLGDTRSVPFTANVDLSQLNVTTSSTWCKAEVVDRSESMRNSAKRVKFVGENRVSESNGGDAQSYAIEITVDPNDLTSERTARVSLKALNGSELAVIDVSQSGKTFCASGWWYADYEVSSDGGKVNRANYIETDYDFEQLQAESSVDWCKCWIEKYGSNCISIGLEVSASTSVQPRTAKITVTCPDKSASISFNVIQEGATLELDESDQYFDRNAGDRTIRGSITGDCEISCSASWVTATKASNGISVHVLPCEPRLDREATVTVTLGNSKKSFKVIQSKYAVGDNYNEDGVTGTVSSMNGSQRYISSKCLGDFQWSTEIDNTGATDEYDGSKNMEIIKARDNWKELYPAFAAVDALNVDGVTGWYLPARYEAGSAVGYTWTSTEKNENAYYNTRVGYSSGYFCSKLESHDVYAVHKF